MATMSTGAAAVPQSQSTIDRMIGICTSPRPTMDDIVARPSWVVPLLIMIVAAGLSGFFLKDLIIEQALDEMAKNPNMTQEQMDAAVPWISGSTMIAPVIFTPVVYVLIAGVFLFVGNVILGGETKFKIPFAVVCWSALITLLSMIVHIPLMLSRGDMTSPTSLAFLAGEDKGSPLFFLFSQFDLFYIWWLVVVGLGFAATYKFTNQKGIVTVFACWAVFLALGMGLKAIF